MVFEWLLRVFLLQCLLGSVRNPLVNPVDLIHLVDPELGSVRIPLGNPVDLIHLVDLEVGSDLIHLVDLEVGSVLIPLVHPVGLVDLVGSVGSGVGFGWCLAWDAWDRAQR